MYGFATFQLLGTCSEDVKFDKLQSGTTRASISLVVNTPEQQEDGSYKERATWIRVAVFGKKAEGKSLAWCKKGVAVGVVGKIQSYQQEIGDKKYTMHNFRPESIRPIAARQGGDNPSDGDMPDYDGPETR